MRDSELLIIGGLLAGAAYFAMNSKQASGPVTRKAPSPELKTTPGSGIGWTGAATSAISSMGRLHMDTARRFRGAVMSSARRNVDGGPIGRLHTETGKKFREGMLNSGVRAGKVAYDSARRVATPLKPVKRTAHKTVRAVSRVQKKVGEIVEAGATKIKTTAQSKTQEGVGSFRKRFDDSARRRAVENVPNTVWDDPTWAL